MRTFLRILYEEVNLFERLSWYNQLMVSIVYVGSNFPIVTHCMIFWAGSIAVIFSESAFLENHEPTLQRAHRLGF